MTKLNRLTAKIFGETASTTNTPKEIGQFGSAKAGTYNATGDVATIQSLPAWSNGWIDAVTPTDQFPPLPEMTGVHKVLSYQNAYLLQQGIPEWDSATTYYTNGFCSKAGKIYISKTDNNLNNDPASDTVNWKVFEVDLSGKADIDLSNCTKPYITETYINGSSWYRVYSDGWCEQGGLRSAGATGSVETITLLKQYKDTNYIALKTFSIIEAASAYYQFICIYNKTVSNFQTGNTSGIQSWSWYACGYIN